MPRHAIVILISLLLAGQAAATTLQRFDLQSLTDSAERVFHGSCIAAEGELIDGIPYTAYHFAVAENVKGEGEDQITVRLIGGLRDGRRFDLVGMPSFAPGEEVVLFLTAPDRRDNPWPVGLSQGKFAVSRGAAKSLVVSQAASAALLLDGAGVAGKGVIEAMGPRPLDEFLMEVRNYAGEEGIDERR